MESLSWKVGRAIRYSPLGMMEVVGSRRLRRRPSPLVVSLRVLSDFDFDPKLPTSPTENESRNGEIE